MSPNLPALLRRRNAREVLHTVHNEPGVSRAEISRRLGISMPTILDIVNRYVRLGIFQELGDRASGGRPATALGIAPDAGRLIVIDLGGTSVRGAAFGMDGRRSETIKLPTDTRSRQSVLDQLEDLVERLSASSAAAHAIAVGAPSYVQDGVVIDAPNLPNWRNVPLQQHLEDRFGFPVSIENDVDLAAVGETFHGAGKGLSDVALVAIGTGIGAGIVIDGKLVRGKAGTAGEIAFLVPDPAMLDTSYGAKGALESVAAMPALAGHLPEGSALAGEGPEAVLRAARNGQRDALLAVDTWSSYLAVGLVALAALCGPQMLVIGGSGRRAFDLIEPRLRASLSRHIPVPPRLAVSTLGDDAALLGGYAYCLDRVMDDLAALDGVA